MRTSAFIVPLDRQLVSQIRIVLVFEMVLENAEDLDIVFRNMPQKVCY